MAKEQDRKPAFEQFMEGVNSLLADRRFREILMELDAANGEDVVSLLAPDPAAFLRYRGVQIPQDFRFSVEKHPEAVPTGVGLHINCYCLQICWLRWCVWICICRAGVAS
jgi:hypothetical protein